MKKRYAIIFLLLINSNAFSLPLNYIFGSFRSSQTLDKIYFLHTENENFSIQEMGYSNNWLKNIFLGSKFNYNDLTVTLDFQNSVKEIVRGCFFSWFKQLDVDKKLILMEYLRPNVSLNIGVEEVALFSELLNNFTSAHLASCKQEKELGDFSTTYIKIGFEQFISDKSSFRKPDEKYENILGNTYAKQYQDGAQEELKNFLSFIDFAENNSPQVSSEVISDLIQTIENLKSERLSENDMVFLFIDSLRRKDPNFSNYFNDYYKMIPYMKSSKLLFEKCFFNEKFLVDFCGNNNIHKNFVLIRLTRSNNYSDNLVWVGL
ncbi:hypothetical protein [Fluviispira multicolorata]|uniref:Uncharacterized protein n=1 Tax=Fluviispira multicolorata TaxID=2654512 RepID=A0A833JB11_9BACT|nr:hypothetical protein [Fluviispira multicolorata]KAB8027978.1 hypothetical protein GCL57_13060 [Fluviispira multicolorata]